MQVVRIMEINYTIIILFNIIDNIMLLVHITTYIYMGLCTNNNNTCTIFFKLLHGLITV